MDERFDIQAYMTRGVENIVSGALRATLKDPREGAFMVRFAAASRKASQRRKEAEKAGEHIPPFLIASITSACNLHCARCYSRCNHATVDGEPTRQLTDEEWLSIFRQAEELGVSFILLAGGEPMLRRGVLEAAGKLPNILFPIFTNGTRLRDGIARLREQYPEVVFVSFPGDEKSSGGCIAAGRGFFHINSHGGAEPCPFSPYSDVNVRDASLRQALASPLLTALQEGELLADDHVGGCVLFEKRAAVEALLKR